MHTRANLSLLSFVEVCTFFVFILLTYTNGLKGKEYIVYMGHLDLTLGISPSILHLSFLQNALGSKSSSKIIHSYNNSFNAFVAILTNDEVKKISSIQGVVSVFPNKINHVFTTKSWDFMGFSQKVKREKTVESDIIIGVLDTGIWPESDSFADIGFGPPPSKWKGSCEGLINFTCNNKIIGARYYKSDGIFVKNDIESPRDTIGHGTHVASIIAGGLVSTSFYGLANGTARGGVPSSRIAVYKVCWSTGCADSNIMAAFDDAINDGVDIISCSIGNYDDDYFKNSIYVGSFHAMSKGILTILAGGNNGPKARTIANVSPWTLTVASSTIDRKFITNLKLGNGATLQGISLNTFDPNGFSPIVYGANVKRRGGNVHNARMCHPNSLSSRLVKGKIIVCEEFNFGETTLLAGAVGMVIQGNISSTTEATEFSLPTTFVDIKDASIISRYIKNARNPTASIMKSYEIIDQIAPYISSTSSRGPNIMAPGILKPDLSAPGVNILAAHSLANSPTKLQTDTRRFPYNIRSGTSMACPHVSAAAAYVKSFHPSWSPSAIKSALMTTAFPMSAKTTPDEEFGYGAGHLNPIGVIDPGLVYESNEEDYIRFLCSLGYTKHNLTYLKDHNTTCSKFEKYNDWNLNMPSFCFKVHYLNPFFTVTFHRRVTNVGFPLSTYNVVIDSSKLKIQVEPNTLSFTRVGQTQSFAVTVKGTSPKTFVSASLAWVDKTHKVRSPIIIYT